MKPGKITLRLDRLKWEALCALVMQGLHGAPVQDYELESLVMFECYCRLNIAFIFFKPNKKGIMKIRLKYAEAFAINIFWAPRSDTYNILLRPMIESKLPASKPFVTCG